MVLVMKKIFVALLTLLLIIIPTPVRAEESLIIDEPVTIGGTTFNTTENAIEGENIYFDYHWLTTACTNSYNSELATFASLLAADAYNVSYVAISNEGKVGNSEVQGILQRDLGLDDFEYYDVSGYDIDEKDTTSIGLAHKVVEINKIKYNVFFASIAGTSDENQWCSNFDLGDAREFNEHEDWTNINNHKGFDVAASRTKVLFDKYIDKHSNSNAINTMLITGHSRGGAIASILGAYYEDRDDINSYVYTFSAPTNTLTSEQEARSYKTIFNIANKEDFITNIPLEYWGYKRYGQDLTFEQKDRTKFKRLATYYLGSAYDSPNVNYIANGFKLIADGREDFFEWISVNIPKFREKELLASIKNGRAEDYWRKNETAIPKKDCVVYDFQKQFLFNAMGIIMNNRKEYTESLESLVDPFILGTLDLVDLSKTHKSFIELLASILPSAIEGDLGIPHYCACSYALTKVIEGEPHYHEEYEIRNDSKPTFLKKGYTGDAYCIDCNSLIKMGKKIDTIPQIDLINSNLELDFYRSEYTGDCIKPKVVVYCNNKVVDEKYYDVTYLDNVNVGTGKVIVTAKQGDIPFAGQKVGSFIIENKESQQTDKSKADDTNESKKEEIIVQDDDIKNSIEETVVDNSKQESDQQVIQGKSNLPIIISIAVVVVIALAILIKKLLIK